MGKLIASLLLLVAVPVSSFAINKCVDASGQTTFQDAPCPGSSRSASTERHHTENSVRPFSGAGQYRAPALDLSGSGDDVLKTALNGMEIMQSDGWRCKASLDVRGVVAKALENCQPFLGKYISWYSPITKALAQKVREDTTWASANSRAIERVIGMANDVDSIAQYVTLQLNSAR